METRANYAAIGLFILVALMTGLGFLYWLTNAGQRAQQAEIRVVFAGAVTGLNTGSAVLFNGIKIGEVADLSLDEKDPNTVVAMIRVDRTKPIRVDTRAVLSYQGLTGVANLQLEGGSRNAPMLLESVKGGGIPTIQAEVSPFQDILESAKNVLNRADSAMEAIDDFIKENGPAFNRTVNNVETFSKALADNAGAIDDALAGIADAGNAIGGIADDLKGTAKRAEEILNAVDPARVAAIVEEVNRSSERLDKLLARAEEVVGGIDPAKVNGVMDGLAEASRGLNETIQRARDVVAAVDPQAVDRLVTNLDQGVQRVSAAADKADRLLASVDSEKVQKIVDDVGTATRNIADASGTITGVISSAQSTLGKVGEVVGAVDPAKVRSTVDDVSGFAASLSGYEPEIDGILADVRSATGSLKRLGETVDARNRDVDIAITDARNLVAQLNGIATRTDGILRKVDGYVEGDGQGLIKQATDTLASIRSVAETLNARIGPITDNVAKFTDRGLGSYTQLAEDGRRALQRLDRVLSGIERNPQQFIFGGEGVPEYAPRRR
ncbi:MlaD family protein [Oharaeibacter diazotrophicus]|uniref:Phospholipid/cholesterol/gamma-HCH transport system substrate-binding protein n=1 Tax=Oharaeibacter diazotrophicus TaxID=1920512 RepID=A0A4R6RMA8_9HYPH|nr:MlaD family protein [Oharaeibacter diazotrophicus]TDP87672.1 phospholipid/cholesterol/gamma-HCH transport system substrate-binding protein [Oharaeibacter diazotrophicus]BBE74744.1 mce related protein [Pleomorphomonas sp. SM30]GLS77127.1 organic solvent ABC transporter substrate-binding protein [Oharaeibacter diazotrophicus]